MNTHAAGMQAQNEAAKWLARQGYRLIAQNFRGAGGEIDLIMSHEGVTVFIEVKYRASTRYGLPREAVGPAKQRRIIRAAQVYIARGANPDGDFRFDVVEVLRHDGELFISHIEGAFGT